MAVLSGFMHRRRIPLVCLYALMMSSLITTSTSQDVEQLLSSIQPSLPTVTVRGFLNFKTTVDGTVIVFTPASEVPPPPTTDPHPVPTSSENYDSPALSTDALLQKDGLNSREGIHGGIEDLSYASPPQNSLEPLKTHVSELNHLENKVKEPFLQHISDNAVLPSAGQVNNDLERITKKVPTPQNQYPTGLVTVLGGTHVDGPSTTVFETRVIGTYIDGKYAQILQSTSHIVIPSPVSVSTPTASIVQRVTSKQVEQQSSSISKIPPVQSLRESPLEESSVILQTPSVESLPELSSLREISLVSLNDVSSTSIASTATLQTQTSSKTMNTPSTNLKEESTASFKHFKENKFRSSGPTLESSFRTPDATAKPGLDRPTQSLDSARPSSFIRTISSFVPVTPTVFRLPDEDNTVATSNKNLRNNTSRIRFLSPRRPSQSVRLNRFKVRLTLRQDSPDEYNVTMPADEDELEEDHTVREDEDMELVTDGLGLILDPARVVFRETTITSEVTLHVGRRKSVRTLTITTSVPLTVNPSDIQDLLSSEATEMDGDATDSDPFHHIITRTFTTTERAVKTSVVPIFDGKSTTYHTVTESFFIMKLITAYRTLPVGDASVLESLLEDQTESEIAPATLEVAANVQPSVIQSAPVEQERPVVTSPPEETVQQSVPLPATTVGHPQLPNPLLSLGHALSNNPLAAVYLGLQQLNAQMTLYSTITDTSSYVTTDTIYSTKTIRFYDGRTTRFRVISDPISTKKRTVTTTVTSVQPYLNTHAIQQQQQLQKLIAATQLSPPQQHFNTITSTYTTVTTATSLSTRIYTLIYNGFSTKFRTVTSTTLHPTTVVLTSTTKVPLAPSQVNLPFAYPYSA